MFSLLTYKRLLLIVAWVFLAVASATAQGAFVVTEGQTHNLFVTNHPGSSYSWVIYNEPSFTTEASSSEISFPNGNNKASVDVLWATAGTYYVAVTEDDQDGCTNTKALVVTVQPNTSGIAFNPTQAGDCADPTVTTSQATASLQLLSDTVSKAPLSDNQYPVTVNYTVTDPSGTTTSYIKVMQDATDFSIQLNGLVNDVSKDQVYDVVLVKATDKYGMQLNISPKGKTFEYTIFKTPVTPDIQMVTN